MTEDNPPLDHHVEDDALEPDAIETHMKSRSTWMRLLYMIVYYVLASLAGMVGTAVVVLSFLLVLFTGRSNPQLKQAGQSIASYLYQIVRYLTFNSDDKPFPFGGAWPSGQP